MANAPLDFEELLALERRGWEALCRSEGGVFYGALMAPEGVMVLVNGAVLNRAEVAETLNDAPPWSTYRIDDARRIPTGDSSAALVYRATASRGNDDEPFVAMMTSHYTLVDGRPALTLYQQTTITH